MAIQVNEEAGSPTESWTWEKGIAARRVLRCAWADRITAFNEQIALVYPYLPTSSLFVLRGTIDAVPARQSQGATADLASYEKALLTLDYGIPEDGQPPGGVDPAEFATESLQVAGEFVTLDASGYIWFGDLKPLSGDESPGRMMKTLEYRYTRKNVSIIPSAVLSLVGSVNSAALTPSTPGMSALTFQPETLLYQPPIMSRRLTSVGASLWDLDFRFVYRPNFDTETGVARGWNYFWRSSKSNYDQIARWISETSGEAVRPYPPKNFLQILL